eukprot:s777_g7.t1
MNAELKTKLSETLRGMQQLEASARQAEEEVYTARRACQGVRERRFKAAAEAESFASAMQSAVRRREEGGAELAQEREIAERLLVELTDKTEVASIPVGELTDVKELKRHLHQLHSYPPRFRQRLLLGGNPMDDSAKLDSPMDLDLVLLAYSAGSQTQADELVTAANDGHVEVVRLLLDAADTNASDSNGNTALICAAERGHVELVRLLLDAGAYNNFANNDGDTALICAAALGHVEVVRLLLDSGADTNVSDTDGVTALKTASDNGHFKVVRMLLDAGADTKTAQYSGITGLMAASIHLLQAAGVDDSSTRKRRHDIEQSRDMNEDKKRGFRLLTLLKALAADAAELRKRSAAAAARQVEVWQQEEEMSVLADQAEEVRQELSSREKATEEWQARCREEGEEADVLRHLRQEAAASSTSRLEREEELIEHYRTSIRTAETAAEGQKGRVAEMRQRLESEIAMQREELEALARQSKARRSEEAASAASAEQHFATRRRALANETRALQDSFNAALAAAESEEQALRCQRQRAEACHADESSLHAALASELALARQSQGALREVEEELSCKRAEVNLVEARQLGLRRQQAVAEAELQEQYVEPSMLEAAESQFASLTQQCSELQASVARNRDEESRAEEALGSAQSPGRLQEELLQEQARMEALQAEFHDADQQMDLLSSALQELQEEATTRDTARAKRQSDWRKAEAQVLERLADASSEDSSCQHGVSLLQQGSRKVVISSISWEGEVNQVALDHGVLFNPGTSRDWMQSFESVDVNGRYCSLCSMPPKERAPNKSYLQRSDCGNSSYWEHPENGKLPLSTFMKEATAEHNVTNGWCELNFEKGCADAVYNRDYMLGSKGNITLNDMMARFQAAKPGTAGSRPSMDDAHFIAAWACAMGGPACDMAYCAYTFCVKEDGSLGIYDDCPGIVTVSLASITRPANEEVAQEMAGSLMEELDTLNQESAQFDEDFVWLEGRVDEAREQWSLADEAEAAELAAVETRSMRSAEEMEHQLASLSRALARELQKRGEVNRKVQLEIQHDQDLLEGYQREEAAVQEVWNAERQGLAEEAAAMASELQRLASGLA